MLLWIINLFLSIDSNTLSCLCSGAWLATERIKLCINKISITFQFQFPMYRLAHSEEGQGWTAHNTWPALLPGHQLEGQGYVKLSPMLILLSSRTVYVRLKENHKNTEAYLVSMYAVTKVKDRTFTSDLSAITGIINRTFTSIFLPSLESYDDLVCCH